MRYNIKGIVSIDVSKGAFLSPYTVFNYNRFDRLCNNSCDVCIHKMKVWDDFDMEKYKKIVLERAVCYLRNDLCRLPKHMACAYVEDSAYVSSQNGKDVLCFQVDSVHEYSEEHMQQLLDAHLIPNCQEEDPQYEGCQYCYNRSRCHIFNYLKEVHSLDCFRTYKSES